MNISVFVKHIFSLAICVISFSCAHSQKDSVPAVIVVDSSKLLNKTVSIDTINTIVLRSDTAENSNNKTTDSVKIEPAPQTINDRIKGLQQKLDFYYSKDHQLKTNKKDIGNNQEKIEENKKSIKQSEDKITLLNTKNKSIKKELSSIGQGFVKQQKETQHKLQEIEGELFFTYKSNKYLAFVANLDSHNIGMHLNYKNTTDKKATKYLQLGKLKTDLERKKEVVLMLTNGGMYTPKNNAEGLLIADTIEIEPIDLGSSELWLNFYLKPNGVFYINNGKAYIEETNAFNEKYKKKEIIPSQATQSGPMLVINGKHHPALNHGSKSEKLRSGVGIMENGKVVFIISAKGSVTNFHDFATIFKDLFGCENALFLDGAISKMYLKQKNPKELYGNFGPMISVTKK
jgi:uncharacterized protein YigE (DUF2233 family)